MVMGSAEARPCKVVCRPFRGDGDVVMLISWESMVNSHDNSCCSAQEVASLSSW